MRTQSDSETLYRPRLAQCEQTSGEARDGEPFHRLGFLGLDEAFLELVDHPAALPLVREVLGWNIYVYHCHLDVHPPVAADAAPAWRWHQDGGCQNVELASPGRGSR